MALRGATGYQLPGREVVVPAVLPLSITYAFSDDNLETLRIHFQAYGSFFKPRVYRGLTVLSTIVR